MSVLFRRNEWLKWAALGITILYSAILAWGIVKGTAARRAAGMGIEWALADNPRTLITLCLIFATVALWNLEYVGKVVASLLFVLVLVRYIMWGWTTANIKTNAGLDAIPASNWVGNIWIGASWWELLPFLAAIVLLLADVRIVWRKRDALVSQWRRTFSHT